MPFFTFPTLLFRPTIIPIFLVSLLLLIFILTLFFTTLKSIIALAFFSLHLSLFPLQSSAKLKFIDALIHLRYYFYLHYYLN